MNRLWIALCLCTLIGCDDPGPGFPPIVPKAPPIESSHDTHDHSAHQTATAEPGPVDPDAPEEFTTTPSGLKYRIRRKSDGVKPTAQDKVKVHYRGTLDNGKQFDASYGKPSGPVEFPLSGVIKGWTEGLQLVGEGGMIELEIPADLAYGQAGRPEIPANSRLHFIVELLEVNPGSKKAKPPVEKAEPKEEKTEPKEEKAAPKVEGTEPSDTSKQ